MALVPATSEPFLTRVQAAPAVVIVRSVATNRQSSSCASAARPSPVTVTALLVTTAPGAAPPWSVKKKGSGAAPSPASPRVTAENQADCAPMTTSTCALPRGAPFATTLTRTVSPSTTVELAPATSEPFLTKVQAAPVVVVVAPSADANRQDR